MTNIIALGLALVVVMSIIILTAQRDEKIPVRYDCRMLIGGWHPDVPVQVREECRKKGYPNDNSKARN
jgi:hypothetical protein